MKNSIFKFSAVIAALVVLITSAVPATFGLVVTRTDSMFNTFTPFDSIINDIVIRKAVEHPFAEDYVIPQEISFDFKVDLGAYYANTAVNTTVGSLTADEKGSIMLSVRPGEGVGIKDIDEGTLVTVTELQRDGSGFTVKDGAVREATVGSEECVYVDYVNVYSPAAVNADCVTVGGVKILEGRDWQQGDEFIFLLEQKTGENTWEALGERSVRFDEDNAEFNRFDFSDIFADLYFDKAGSYSFRVSEKQGSLENINYDKTVNCFDILVGDADMNGSLEIQNVSVTDNAVLTKNDTNGEFEVEITFNNTFVPSELPNPEDITVNVGVSKSVKNTGKHIIGPEGFEFVLENTETGAASAVRTDKYGYAEFKLVFTYMDIGRSFSYTLSETDEGKTGITYDPDVYAITINVTLDEDNLLHAEMAVNGEKTKAFTAEYENVYFNNDDSAPPTGVKKEAIGWVIAVSMSAVLIAVLLIINRKRGIFEN